MEFIYSKINSNYSCVELLNDFYHIKYNHNTNDDSTEFNIFYRYLCGSELQCNIESCDGSRRYYNGRDINKNTINSYPLNLICRIHTYFIHSYETATLTQHEIAHINNKFITTNHQMLDYSTISNMLKNHDIIISAMDLETAFMYHSYHKQQLINDLCAISLNTNDENTLLSNILLNDLQQTDEEKRNIICQLLLHKYIRKDDLNTTNFVNILQMTASKINKRIDMNVIAAIAYNQNLTVKMFEKRETSFKNSIAFAKIFKTTENWKKKEWTNIYITINKWLKKWESSTVSYKPENKSEQKTKYFKQQDVDYIDKETDEHRVQQFCASTNTSRDIAVNFLNKANWNVSFAINKYLNQTDQSDNHNNDPMNKNNSVYHSGIPFWYWENFPPDRIFIKSKMSSLKQEILMFKDFSYQNWELLCKECSDMSKTDKVKHIYANDNCVDGYDVQKDEIITQKHLHSIKLYTDYSWLCSIFCDTFRCRQVSQNQYERIQSVILRNEKVANMAKLLIETVQCFGTLMQKKRKYYRGIDNTFVFKRFITRFNAPLSTTTSFDSAKFFAVGGIIMQLKAYKPQEHIAGFDCSSISDFDHEKEVLFFGSNFKIKIFSIWVLNIGKWRNYKNYLDGVQCIMNIADGTVNWKQVNVAQDIITFILYDQDHGIPEYIKLLLHHYLNNVPKIITYDLKKMLYELNIDENQWIRDTFLTPEYVPNLSNAHSLFKNCKHIKILMPSVSFMDTMYSVLMKDLLGVIQNGVTVEFEWDTENIKLFYQRASSEHRKYDNKYKIHKTAKSIVFKNINGETLQNELKTDVETINHIHRMDSLPTPPVFRTMSYEEYDKLEQCGSPHSSVSLSAPTKKYPTFQNYDNNTIISYTTIVQKSYSSSPIKGSYPVSFASTMSTMQHLDATPISITTLNIDIDTDEYENFILQHCPQLIPHC
eukprot:137498_1